MSRKSYVNARLREAVKYDVRMCRPYLLGRKALDTSRAWLERVYDGIPSGMAYQADDFTLPVYWLVPDGHGWFNLVRGQCLIVIDFRTLRILGFSLQPDRNYNSAVIHTLLKRVFTDWGVPKILYFERGIWRDSKIITGGVRAGRVKANWQYLPLAPSEVARGFGDLGVRFMHAIRARSKNVERVGGAVQSLMEGEPGYCGRDERHDCPELTKRQMDDVKFQRVHPSKHFYDFNQWEARLREIFEQYNRTPQEGKILNGLTPDAAQEQMQDAENAPMNFDCCRHLLAHYRSQREVKGNGITIWNGGKPFTYRNTHTARDKGKQVLAWWNPEEPSILAVTDLNMRNPYSVPLARGVGAIDPDPQAFARELGLIEEHETYAKARFQVLKAHFNQKFRRVVPSPSVVETGAEMRRQNAEIKYTRRTADNHARNVQRRASDIGLPSSILNTDPEADEGTRLMQQALKANERANRSIAPEETT